MAQVATQGRAEERMDHTAQGVERRAARTKKNAAEPYAQGHLCVS
ncbi:MAG: hypothetical protein R6V55_00660 [Desulfovermiculus sp.]